MLPQEHEGFDALGEDDEAVTGLFGVPVEVAAYAQEGEQPLVLGELVWSNGVDGIGERAQGVAVPLGFRGCHAFDLFQALLDGLAAGGRAGEKGLFEHGPKQKLTGLLRLLEGGEGDRSASVSDR